MRDIISYTCRRTEEHRQRDKTDRRTDRRTDKRILTWLLYSFLLSLSSLKGWIKVSGREKLISSTTSAHLKSSAATDSWAEIEGASLLRSRIFKVKTAVFWQAVEWSARSRRQGVITYAAMHKISINYIL
jgi:hypothetical protein